MYISTSKTTVLSKVVEQKLGSKLWELRAVAKQMYATEQCMVFINQGNLDFANQFSQAEQSVIINTLNFFGSETIFSDCPYKMRASEALAAISANVKRK